MILAKLQVIDTSNQQGSISIVKDVETNEILDAHDVVARYNELVTHYLQLYSSYNNLAREHGYLTRKFNELAPGLSEKEISQR